MVATARGVHRAPTDRGRAGDHDPDRAGILHQGGTRMMRMFAVVSTVIFLASGTSAGGAQSPIAPPATPPAVRLHMPDGQLKSHYLTVYVTGTIVEAQNPRLRLIRSHSITEADP